MPVAHIAGGGIAGLVASIGLAQNGWDVTVHERSAALRARGNGFPIFENGLRIIEALGLGDEIERSGHRLERWVICRSKGQKVIEYDPFEATGGRIVMFHRQAVIDLFSGAARDAGVTLRAGARAVGAEREGVLHLGDGSRVEGDLVVGADGVFSAVRAAVAGELPIGRHRKGAIRLMIPILPGDFPDGNDRAGTEYNDESGRRVGLLPCSHDLMYMILVALLSDTEANVLPIDVNMWTETFPTLRRYFERVGENAHYDVYHSVYPPAWHYGRCALVGDAAHGMTPALGQGANSAMMTAYALAAAIGRDSPDEEILAAWEARVRPLVNFTQRYAEAMTAGRLDPRNEIFFSDPVLRPLLEADVPRLFSSDPVELRIPTVSSAIAAELAG